MNRDEYLADYRKRYGKESVQAPGEGVVSRLAAISTGSHELNTALGIGGVPVGRLTEIYGPESAGKTTLCYELIASCQKAGGTCAMVDAEHSADPTYAEAIGVEWNAITFVQPDNGEAGLEFVAGAAKHGIFDLIVVDSVAALTPKVVIQGEVGDHTVGALARLMGSSIPKIAAAANRSQSTIVFTNQIREKVGVLYGSPETQPGGRALRFHASTRIDLRSKERNTEGGVVVSSRVHAKVVKNKVAPPYHEADFTIVYGKGIDRAADRLAKLLHTGEVTKAGKFYTLPDGTKVEGKARAIEQLKEQA